MAQSLFATGGGIGPDFITRLAMNGRVFYASDADQNDTVTGQTSFAATTPTFMIDVPSGTTCIPLMVSLFQTGAAAAGGAINVLIEIDNADRYASGGTAETVLGARTTGAETNACTVYSGATANSGYGVRIFGATLGPDISPAEGAVQEVLWTPQAGYDFLVGPAGFLVYTYASTPGPEWNWTIKWAEFPTNEFLS